MRVASDGELIGTFIIYILILPGTISMAIVFEHVRRQILAAQQSNHRPAQGHNSAEGSS